MANYPCPVCGASHKTPPVKCRLCGQQMGEDSVVGDFDGAKYATAKKKGVGGIAVLAAVIVAVLVLAGVLIGVLPGREEITGVATKVPGLQGSTKAGWAILDDSETGGFKVEMPSDTPESEPRVIDLLGTPTDQVVWTAWIGEDSLIEVAYAKNALPDGAREFDAVATVGDALDLEFAASNTATVEQISETTFKGHPAIQISARNVQVESQPGTTFHQRTIVFFNDGTLFTITEYTTTPKSDAFDQVRSTFTLTENAPVAGAS